MVKKAKIITLTFLFLTAGEGFAVNSETGTDKGGNLSKTQVFSLYKYRDPMAGLEAFRLLVPKGWKADGAINWSANPALPAQSHFRFINPKGTEELEFFPAESYFWTDNRTALQTNPPGSLRFNTLVKAPVSLDDAFTEVVLRRYRSDVTRLRIIDRQRLPGLAQLAKGTPVPGVEALAEGGKVRIEYRHRGKLMEEEIYAVVSQYITHLPGSMFTPGYYINYWYVDYVFSFKAEKGRLNAHSKTFQTMIFSLKINPKWFAKLVNTKELIAQRIIEGIEAIGRIGSVIAEASSQLRTDQQAAWEQRQSVQDKIAENYSGYIRGVERFHDPFRGGEVELPAGYGHAWSNNLGEYIVTDSPSYNPGINSSLHWERLQPTR